MDQALASEGFASTGPKGHRGRMRTRLLANEAALADYEILEMLLFLGIERRDTKPLAKLLVNRFGNLADALAAPAQALSQAGLPRRAAEVFALVAEAADCLARPERYDRVTLASWDALEEYLDLPARAGQAPSLGGLLLNNRNQLLAEPSWAPETDFGQFARDLLRTALDRQASALIIVRNRGRQPVAIAPEDRALCASVRRAAAALSVQVHDLIVLGAGDWASLRQMEAR